MEEPNAPSRPPTGRFMDIARPQSGEDAVTPPQSAAEPAVASPQTESPVIVQTAPEVVEAPVVPTETVVEQQPAVEPKPELSPVEAPEPVGATPAPKLDESHSAKQPEPSDKIDPIINQEAEQPAQAEHPQLPPKTHKAPMLAIFVAMAICLTLTGLVVFTYIKSKNDTKTTTSSSNSKTTVEKPQASPDDIDRTSSDIDQTLSSVNDAVDFSAAALSDQSLGL